MKSDHADKGLLDCKLISQQLITDRSLVVDGLLQCLRDLLRSACDHVDFGQDIAS